MLRRSYRVKQQRVGSASVEYIVADLFSWTPNNNSTLYSLVLALSYRWNNLPFWQMVKEALNKWAGLFL